MEIRSQSYRPSVLPAVLFLIGFTSVIAQIVLMRELIVVFQGNEISLGALLACWLFWTAMGSGVLGRWMRRLTSTLGTIAWLEVIIAIVLPATVMAVRAVRSTLDVTPGEILGPGPAFITSFFVLSIFCLASGGLFAAGSRAYREKRKTSTAAAAGSVYLLEAAGSCAGGILTGLFLIEYVSPVEIVVILAVLNVVAAAGLRLRLESRRAVLLWLSIGTGFVLLSPLAARPLESYSLRYLWRGFNLVLSRNSIYGNLAVTTTENTKSIFSNGLIYLTVPDPESAEENAHYALLQHPSPRKILMIGGGLNGSLERALLHPTVERLEYVELDPAVLALAREHLGDVVTTPESDPRVELYNLDGRLFVKRSGGSYDVIAVNLPDPQTAQLNRLYTLEFFRDASRRLSPGGILSFQVAGSENYVSEDQAAFLRCLKKTLARVFPEVVVFPGSTIQFFASSGTGALTADAEILLGRLRGRGITTRYLREYYIPFRLSPDRMQDLESNISPLPHTPVNKDLTPVAYYFNGVLWSTRFNRQYATLLRSLAVVDFAKIAGGTAVVLLIISIVLFFTRRGRGRFRTGAGLCAAALGFTVIGLEVLLLLAFQAIHGHVYHHLAVIVAGFMAGMALGSFLSLRRRPSISGRHDGKTLILIQAIAAVSPVLLVWFFAAASGVSNSSWLFLVSDVCFPAFAVLLGGLGGYQFPVAGSAYFRCKAGTQSGPGAVYALDLAGACVGAVLVSGYFLPVLGFLNTAVLLALINLAPLALVALSLPAPRRAS